MKHVLARRHRARLLACALPGAVLGFDFDGTLAPIAADRGAARMRPATRLLLARLCDRQPVAILSGRSRDDLSNRLEGVQPELLVGNHGIEPGAGMRRFAASIARARVGITAALSGMRGVELEDKTYSLTVHYRRAVEPGIVLRAIRRAVAESPVALRVLDGVLVVNLLPAKAPGKGAALRRFCADHRATAALYVGDEDTDEDVFGMRPPPDLLAVRVGRSPATAAPYYLRDQHEMDELLEILLRGSPWRQVR